MVFLNCHPALNILIPHVTANPVASLTLCSFYMHIIAHHISCQWSLLSLFLYHSYKTIFESNTTGLNSTFFYIHPTILTLILLLVIEAFSISFRFGKRQLKLNQLPLRAFLMINTPVMLKWKEWQRVISGIVTGRKSDLWWSDCTGPRTARRDI